MVVEKMQGKSHQLFQQEVGKDHRLARMPFDNGAWEATYIIVDINFVEDKTIRNACQLILINTWRIQW